MKLSHRIFLGYFLVVAVAGLFLLKSVRDEFRPAVRQAMEETMVDTANFLAEMVGVDVRKATLADSDFSKSMQRFLDRTMNAEIWGLEKNQATSHVYITDATGLVIFDSNQGKAVGKDYSRWNDVHFTLQGKYGARTTRANEADETSSTMYVAAPIKYKGEIIGVLTVYKPSISVLPFIQLSQKNITQAALVLFVLTLALGWLFSEYLARSTRKLMDYAHAVQKGAKVSLPEISEPELYQLGQAIEAMREALDGKHYIENYVHTLTHELKSPLSGIAGASELLTEDMAHQDRSRFIKNIREETHRIQDIVDRLLELARLEQRQHLDDTSSINLKVMVQGIVSSFEVALLQKNLQVMVDVDVCETLSGDPFLIRQTLNNVIDNAIEFSPKKGVLTIKGVALDGRYLLSIFDQGPGVPEYATAKIFDRFYSLPRPDTHKKSTGLGLSFAKEVMLLHQGDISISTQTDGCQVELSFVI